MLQFFERDATTGTAVPVFLLSREVGNAVGKNFYTLACLDPQQSSVPVRATISPPPNYVPLLFTKAASLPYLLLSLKRLFHREIFNTHA